MEGFALGIKPEAPARAGARIDEQARLLFLNVRHHAPGLASFTPADPTEAAGRNDPTSHRGICGEPGRATAMRSTNGSPRAVHASR